MACCVLPLVLFILYPTSRAQCGCFGNCPACVPGTGCPQCGDTDSCCGANLLYAQYGFGGGQGDCAAEEAPCCTDRNCAGDLQCTGGRCTVPSAPNGGVTKPNTCTCTDGIAATGTLCTADNAAICTTCQPGFTLSNGVCEAAIVAQVGTGDCPAKYEWWGNGESTADAWYSGTEGWWWGGGQRSFKFSVPEGCATSMQLHVIYARGRSGDGKQTATLGDTFMDITYPPTGGWEDMRELTVATLFDVGIGEHTLSIACDDGQNTAMFSLVPSCTMNPPENSRAYSSVVDDDAIGTGHAQSALDSPQAWSAKANSVGEWMQIDLGKPSDIRGVVVQGRANIGQWVTNYQVKYSTDGLSWDDVPGSFAGSTDSNTKMRQEFTPARGRYVRLIPQSWQGHMSMRAGVLVYGVCEAMNHETNCAPVPCPAGFTSCPSGTVNLDRSDHHPAALPVGRPFCDRNGDCIGDTWCGHGHDGREDCVRAAVAASCTHGPRHYDGQQHHHHETWHGFAPCYVLWPVAIIYGFISKCALDKALTNSADLAAVDKAEKDWGCRKTWGFIIFVICTVFHFACAAWLGWLWVPIFLAPCIILGIVIPICFCASGDKRIGARREEIRKRPAVVKEGWMEKM
mmetsp:Transcript_61631/g.170843  ORF Transcript_61631/g.170843 Transcript_61631/m.170843 type:complete len:626 (+) Transcript_61631:77-1954(+)